MNSRPQQGQRPAPRLYLVTPPVSDPAAMLQPLASALGAADVAAVLLRLAPADERTLINRIKALAPAVQRAGAALVLDGHPDIAARAGADGAHLTGLAAFQAAVGSLRPERIAGAGGLKSRHDAMAAGENGADYVMFGEPEREAPAGTRRAAGGAVDGPGMLADVLFGDGAAVVDGAPARRPTLAAVVERVAWWSEVFEIPCVAYAERFEELSELCGAGADFIAVGDMIFSDPRGCAAAMADAAARLAPQPTAA